MDAGYDWDRLIQEDRVHRRIYTDPGIFEKEMSNIFGTVWVYIAHESQIPENDDFVTARLGLRSSRLGRHCRSRLGRLLHRGSLGRDQLGM